MTKPGDQYLIDAPFFGEQVIICISADHIDDDYHFVEVHDGSVAPGVSITFHEEDLKNGGGGFNLRPIDEKHPLYVKDWEELPQVKLGILLDKMAQDEAAGVSPDVLFDELQRGMDKMYAEEEAKKPRKKSRKS